MNPTRRTMLFIGALALYCAVIWSQLLLPEPRAALQVVDAKFAEILAPASPVEQTRERVAALLSSHPALALDARQKTSHCAVAGAFPDHSCTPGAVFVGAATSTICVAGYTKTVRNVSTKLRKQLYAAYGIAYPPPSGSYELDHLIPLALGGNNDAANLFPEAASPKPGFKEKDVVEVYLYQEVCAGRLPLAGAQTQIANDWVAVYKALDPATISAIRQKYRNWSN